MHAGRFALKIFPVLPMRISYGHSSQLELNSRSRSRQLGIICTESSAAAT
jgi:hypothetical protein